MAGCLGTLFIAACLDILKVSRRSEYSKDVGVMSKLKTLRSLGKLFILLVGQPRIGGY